MSQNMESKTLGSFLYSLREREGISQRGLAEKLQISYSYVSEIEQNRRFPSVDVLERIAKHFKIKVTALTKFDNRIRLNAIRRMIDDCPELGIALKRIIQDVHSGRLSPADVAKKLLSSE